MSIYNMMSRGRCSVPLSFAMVFVSCASGNSAGSDKQSTNSAKTNPRPMLDANSPRRRGQTPSPPKDHWQNHRVLSINHIRWDPKLRLLLLEESLFNASLKGVSNKSVLRYLRTYLRSTEYRLVYRRMTDGKVVRVIKKMKIPTFVLQDAWGGYITTISEKRNTVQLSRYGKMIRTLSIEKGLAIHCAQIVPGTKYVALCLLQEGKRKTARATLRLWNTHKNTAAAEVHFDYRRKTYHTGKYNKRIRVPGGWHSRSFGRSAAPHFDVACRLRLPDPKIERCSAKDYSFLMPREFWISAAVSHDGKMLALVVFGDLHIFKIGAELVRDKIIKDVTYIDRNWNMTSPKVEFSADDKRLFLYGYGRVIRTVGIPEYSVSHVFEKTPIKYAIAQLFPVIGDVDYNTASGSLYYARMNSRAIGISKLPSGGERTLSLKCGRKKKYVCENAILGVNFPTFIRVGRDKVIINSGGMLLVVDKRTGRITKMIGYQLSLFPGHTFFHQYKQLIGSP